MSDGKSVDEKSGVGGSGGGGSGDSGNAAYLERYGSSLLGVFGRPRLALTHGHGCYVWDADGNRYLDLLAGIAVSSLGHAHPALVEAITSQAHRMLHVSNFFTSPAQVLLAERLLSIADAPDGSAVFFANSGTEAIEAAVKLTRRTGRRRIVAAEGAFHGRTTGALALTAKPAYREPFLPLLERVTHIPYDDVPALRAAVGTDVAAVVLEPIQGEAGVVVPDEGYLRAAREIASAAGALLVLDEVQTGIGRTGSWFAHQQVGVRPDVVTVAKGLGGGVPIGAMLTFGADVTGLLAPGQHGTTFGGNPLACAAALAVLDTIVTEGLLEHVTTTGKHISEAVLELGHPLVREVRGAGLLQAVQLAEDRAVALSQHAQDAGFLVNPVQPAAIRLAPPLIVSAEQIDSFVHALPGLLDATGLLDAATGGPS